VARRATPSETLPATSLPSVPRPRLPSKIRSAPSSSPRRTISSSARTPTLRWVAATSAPSSASLSASASRRFRAARLSNLKRGAAGVSGSIQVGKTPTCITCNSAPLLLARSAAARAASAAPSEPSVASRIFRGSGLTQGVPLLARPPTRRPRGSCLASPTLHRVAFSAATAHLSKAPYHPGMGAKAGRTRASIRANAPLTASCIQA